MRSIGEHIQGWQPDPTGRHLERYFSQGQPTKLYRDGKVEGYDDVPATEPVSPCRQCFTPTRASDRLCERCRSVAASDIVPSATITHTPGLSSDSRVASAPAGWYSDPQAQGQQRYWNGSAWTTHVQESRPISARLSSQLGGSAHRRKRPVPETIAAAAAVLMIAVVATILVEHSGSRGHPPRRVFAARNSTATPSSVSTTVSPPPSAPAKALPATTTISPHPNAGTAVHSLSTWVSQYWTVLSSPIAADVQRVIGADIQEVEHGSPVARTAGGTLLSTACSQLGRDLSKAQASPPIPNAEDQSHWSTYLADLRASIPSCLALATDPSDTQDLDTSASEVSMASEQVQALEILLGVPQKITVLRGFSVHPLLGAPILEHLL